MFRKWKERKEKNKEKETTVAKNDTPKSNKRRMDAFFLWLGNFVTRRYKVILIVGALSAAAAIYPAIPPPQTNHPCSRREAGKNLCKKDPLADSFFLLFFCSLYFLA